VTLAGGYDLVVFDLDGVVYLGKRAVHGAPQAIQAILDAGTAVAYATNNASRRAAEVADHLGTLGVPARPEDVVTSAHAAACLLADDLPAGAPVLVVGTPALREELLGVGLVPASIAQERPVAVVQGYGPQVGWPMLAEACVAIRAGARWVVTNLDATMPSECGPLPGNGSLVAALSTALGGRMPDTVVGKPEPVLFETAAGVRAAHRVLVVGDRLDTDIEGARRAGMDSLLVLTGVTTPADLLGAAAHLRPTHVAADCSALSMSDGRCRVPAWRDGAAVAGRWRVTCVDDHLVLRAIEKISMAAPETLPEGSTVPDGPAGRDHPARLPTGDEIDALRALAGAAWEAPQWTLIVAEREDAQQAVSALGLGRYVPLAHISGLESIEA
jgi:HAD superfamily hydrolase (TIGR01450 family)